MPFLLLALVFVAVGSPAYAQIYSWRDANGAQVYSDRPRTHRGEVVTFAVGPRPSVRATRQVAPGVAGRFNEIIERHAATSGVSPDLIKAVIQVESGFNPAAVSPKGAQGLMQLMPATARELGVVDAFHPEENIRGGVAYLKQLLGQYSQDVQLALAAYNAGPGSVARYGGIPPYGETQAYVKKVTAAAPQPARAPAARSGAPQLYKWVEIVDGRTVPHYSDRPPVGHAFEVVRR